MLFRARIQVALFARAVEGGALCRAVKRDALSRAEAFRDLYGPVDVRALSRAVAMLGHPVGGLRSRAFVFDTGRTVENILY